MNISQRQLQAFTQVARLGNFTRAAEVLHITQSGLSAMMRDLETQLNCRLFDRTTRSVVLTPAGLQLVPAAARILAELDSVSDYINQVTRKANETLTVGATPFIAANVMPGASHIFASQYPDVRVRIKELGREKIQEHVGDGTLDMGFGVFFKPASGIERNALVDCHLALVSPSLSENRSKNYVKRVARTPWSALHNKTLISLPQDNPVQQLIEEHFDLSGVANQSDTVYEQFQTILAMVESNIGVAVLPSFISTASHRYRFEISILTDPLVPLNFYQITKKGRTYSECTVAFADAVKEVLQVGARTRNRKPIPLNSSDGT